MSKKLYNIVMNPGVPETDLLENEARDMELKLNPDLFDGIIVLILNEEEADIIRASGKVQFCEPEPEVFEDSYPAVTPKYEIPSNSTTQYLTRYVTSVPLSVVSPIRFTGYKALPLEYSCCQITPSLNTFADK